MSTIGKQFTAIINPRVERAIEKGAVKMANAITDQMEENSLRGRGFGADPYVNVYHPRSVEDRKRLGLQTGIVELRRVSKRIEDTKVVYTKGDGATIRFMQDGIIFKEHHEGKALSRPFNRNVPMRSIFPKSLESVPTDIIEDTQTYVHEVLSGAK
jgi:hypothetical protein